jgi:hypothetical protein
MHGVERLSLVAKVLMDTRLLELKRENGELKLKLFWKEHNPSMLRQAMAAANMVEGGPRCACLACIVGGRCANGTRGFAPYPFAHEYDGHLVMSPYDRCHVRCQFKPWFEDRIGAAGMSVGGGVRGMASPVWVKGCVVHDGQAVLGMDDGRHFSNLGGADWNEWVYGPRLWKASSAGDPELGKLESLFRALELVDECGLPLPQPHTTTWSTTPIGSSSR